MTSLRTAFLAAALGFAALPAAAGSFGFDLPRLDFPTGVDVSRGTAAPVATPETKPGN